MSNFSHVYLEKKNNHCLFTLTSPVVCCHGLRILSKLPQTTLSMNHEVLTCQGLGKDACCLVFGPHLDQCRCPILSIWDYMITHPIKRNAIRLDLLWNTGTLNLEHSDLPGEKGVGLHRVICGLPNTSRSHTSSCMPAYMV